MADYIFTCSNLKCYSNLSTVTGTIFPPTLAPRTSAFGNYKKCIIPSFIYVSTFLPRIYAFSIWLCTVLVEVPYIRCPSRAVLFLSIYSIEDFSELQSNTLKMDETVLRQNIRKLFIV